MPGRVKADARILVGEVVEPLRPEQRSGGRDAGVDWLARSGHHAALDQAGNAIADQTGMHSEVAPVADACEHRVGNRAHPNLDRGAVVDIAADVRGDRFFDDADWLRVYLRRTTRGANDVIDAARINSRIAIGPRGLVVDLGDDHARPRHRGLLM